MTPLQIRVRKAARSASSDASELGTRILEIIEDAIDQVGDMPRPDADDARHVARRLRNSRAVETAGAVIVAGVPIATRVVQRRANRRNARRVAKLVPFAVRTHPVVFSAAVVGGALLGIGAVRRMRSTEGGNLRLLQRADKRRSEIAEGFDLDEEVARMEGEGGDPGAYEDAPLPLTGSVPGNGSGRGRMR